MSGPLGDALRWPVFRSGVEPEPNGIQCALSAAADIQCNCGHDECERILADALLEAYYAGRDYEMSVQDHAQPRSGPSAHREGDPASNRRHEHLGMPLPRE